MEAINSDQVSDEGYHAREEVFIPFGEKEIMNRCFYYYNEPSDLFRGGIIGLFLCLPIWILVFCFIT